VVGEPEQLEVLFPLILEPMVEQDYQVQSQDQRFTDLVEVVVLIDIIRVTIMEVLAEMAVVERVQDGQVLQRRLVQ
jgi:hypothetical protein